MPIDYLKIIIPFLVGILFVASYFYSEKNEFFKFFAYFPRKRKGSVKTGSIIFGAAFTLVALYNLLIEIYK